MDGLLALCMALDRAAYKPAPARLLGWSNRRAVALAV